MKLTSALTIVVGAIGAPHLDAGQSRIVGGQNAGIGEYPFFVEWDGCGASLIHKG
jgi:secreted trypsin-like serine protease